MALPASRLSRIVDRAGEHADEIEEVAPGVAAQGVKAAPATEKDDAFDVWSHTVAGAEGASQEQPLETWETAAESPSREWARTDGEGVGASLDQQADEALRQFQLLTNQREPEPGEQKVEGVLGGVGATFEVLTGLEQMISAPLAMLPFPAFPALRVMDMDIGLPHGHTHPPNLVPPAPMVFLPSTGPIIPIPFLSGATRTLINGMPAGRCGDMGLGVWCGGYFPMYEVFLGSSSVWIEGARAGRLLVDVTRHCMFSSPKPSDPPLGPMVGMTITASPNVLIGGVPMPSLLDLAMGKAIEGLFKGIGKAAKRAKAARAAREADEVRIGRDRSSGAGGGDVPSVQPYKGTRPTEVEYHLRLFNAKFMEGDTVAKRMDHLKAVQRYSQQNVDRMIRQGKIRIETTDPELERMAREDLYHVYANPEGRKTLDRIGRSDHEVTIKPKRGEKAYASNKGPQAFGDPSRGISGRGTNSDVGYDPTTTSGPDSTPDTTLYHELEHAANNAEGGNRGATNVRRGPDGKLRGRPTDPPTPSETEMPGRSLSERQKAAKTRYTNMEEYNTVTKENVYRDQYNQRPRWGHRNMSVMNPR